mgnify:CR=1 FL=1
MAQDVVGGGDMEKEVRQDEIEQIVRTGKMLLAAAQLHRHLPRIGAVELRLRDRLQEGDRLIDPRLQFGEGRFRIGEAWVLDAGKPRDKLKAEPNYNRRDDDAERLDGDQRHCRRERRRVAGRPSDELTSAADAAASEDVLEELVDSLFVRIGAAIVRIDIDKDVKPQLEHNVRAIVATFLDDPALTQLVLSYAVGLDREFMDKVASFYDGARVRVAEALAEGQKLGIVAEGDASFQATFAIAALKEVLLEATHAKKQPELETIEKELFRFFEKGLLRVPPSTGATLTGVEVSVVKRTKGRKGRTTCRAFTGTFTASSALSGSSQ